MQEKNYNSKIKIQLYKLFSNQNTEKKQVSTYIYDFFLDTLYTEKYKFCTTVCSKTLKQAELLKTSENKVQSYNFKIQFQESCKQSANLTILTFNRLLVNMLPNRIVFLGLEFSDSKTAYNVNLFRIASKILPENSKLRRCN